jgi:DNA/RNA endonuclease YhcR with UshA esterase domain
MNTTRLFAALAVLSLWAFPISAASVSPEDAAGHIGETATICGVVASAKYEATARSQPTLLDLGKSYPHAIFTAVIYGDDRSKFGTPETSLPGKRICVTGKISDYRGKPEIVLTDPNQLTE